MSIGSPEKMEPITKVSHIPSSRWALVCSLCNEKFGASIQVIHLVIMVSFSFSVLGLDEGGLCELSEAFGDGCRIQVLTALLRLLRRDSSPVQTPLVGGSCPV